MTPAKAPASAAGPNLRAYGGEGGDKRVARRREALIDGALESLGGDGGGAITVRGVCKRAGLTARYFYENFESVDQLVGDTFDRVIAEITEGALAAFNSGGAAQQRVRGAVEAIVAVIDTDRRKGRVLFSQHLLSPTVAQRRLSSTETFALLTVESAAVDASPLSLAAAHFRVGGFARVLAAWLDGHLDLDRAQVVDVCTELLLGQPVQ